MDISQLYADKQSLEQTMQHDLQRFIAKYPNLRVTVLHEWTDLRKAGDQREQQSGHAIRVQVAL